MKKTEEKNRRSFLKHVLTGTAAVAGAVAIIQPATSRSAPTLNLLDEKLYYESESFKKYYKTLTS